MRAISAALTLIICVSPSVAGPPSNGHDPEKIRAEMEKVRKELEQSRQKMQRKMKQAGLRSRRPAGSLSQRTSAGGSAAREKFERESQLRKEAREREAERLRRGPSRDELLRAGDPLEAARRYLNTAKSASSPAQLKPLLSESVWRTYETQKSHFDPDLAARKLREVAGRTGSDADLTRRVHKDPAAKLVDKHRENGRTLVKVSDPKLDRSNLFRVTMTGHMYPPGDPSKLGRHYKLYPFGKVIMDLEDGQWRLVRCEWSISVTTYR